MTDKPEALPIIDFHWEALGIEEGGLPKHLPMGVNAEDQGPENDHDAHHWQCWCPDDNCPLNAPLRQAWLAGRRVERDRFEQILVHAMNMDQLPMNVVSDLSQYVIEGVPGLVEGIGDPD